MDNTQHAPPPPWDAFKHYEAEWLQLWKIGEGEPFQQTDKARQWYRDNFKESEQDE